MLGISSNQPQKAEEWIPSSASSFKQEVVMPMK
jgi:hypothetical protein